MKRSGIHRPKKRSLATVSAGRDGPSVFRNKKTVKSWHEMWCDEVGKLQYIFGSIYIGGSHPHSETILQVSTWIDSWTAWHAAPPCHDFFEAQWTQRHLHAMAPGTLQTILYLMINGSAIRVWGMWHDEFVFITIPGPPIKCFKKIETAASIMLLGHVCPHPVPRSVPSRWSSAALESAHCCGHCCHECRIPWPPKQSECLWLSQINIGMLRL